MIKLKEIRIIGFKNFNVEAKVSFSNNQMSIIYGANGVGKTTLLDIIYAVFDKNEDRLLIENVRNVQINYILEGIENEIEIISFLDDDKITYNWNEFENSPLNNIKILYISTVRALNHYRGNFTSEALINYLRNNIATNININSTYLEIEDLVKYINGTSYDYISSILEKEKSIFIQGINMSDIEKLITNHIIDNEKNKDKFNLELGGEIISITTNYLEQLDKNRTEICEKNIQFSPKEMSFMKNHLSESLFTLINKISSLEINSNIRNSYLKQIKKLIRKSIEIEKEIDVLNVFYKCTGKKIFFDKTLKIDSFGNIHPIQNLSHGEKHLITLLSLIKYIGSKKDIILIDEPCIALDTMWQEKLLTIISSISDKQFVIATQSPYLSIDYMNDQLGIDGGLQHV